jgi:hypothetical protein
MTIGTHETRVHIDQHAFESPNPTTGEALYVLGRVPPGKSLFREVHGDKEDKLVRRNDSEVRLHQDEHFHSGEIEIKIFVNTRPSIVHDITVSFEQVTVIAFPESQGNPKVFFSVAYRKAVGDKHGTLTAGHSVEVKEGTIFDVTKTDKS